jgi:plastocyanin
MFGRTLAAIALIAGMGAAGACQAADLSVTVRDKAGRPVRDAVIMIDAGSAPAPRPQGSYAVVQQNLKFDPFVLIAPVGADVSFPNRDTVRHHVYSFSPTKPFELKLYGSDQAARSVRFDKVGVVALGCNIHDSMVAFIRVVNTPFAAKTDAAGKARLRGMPAGATKVTLWHPYLKAPRNEVVRPFVLGANETALTLDVDLRAAPDHSSAY